MNAWQRALIAVVIGGLSGYVLGTWGEVEGLPGMLAAVVTAGLAPLVIQWVAKPSAFARDRVRGVRGRACADSRRRPGDLSRVVRALPRRGREGPSVRSLRRARRWQPSVCRACLTAGSCTVSSAAGATEPRTWCSSRLNSWKSSPLYTIVFERWLHFFELRYGTRSEDYPFTYIELHVDEKGIAGTLLPAAKIRFNKQNMVEIENFGIYPARLVDVKREP